WRQRDAHSSLAHALTCGEDTDLSVMHRALAQTDADEALAEQLMQAAPRAEGRSGPSGAADVYEAAARLVESPSRRGALLVLAAETAWEGVNPARAGALLALSAVSPLQSADQCGAA